MHAHTRSQTQMAPYMNSSKHLRNYNNLTGSFRKHRSKNFPTCFMHTKNYNLDTKNYHEYYKKEKVQANLTSEYSHKNPKNISYQNPGIYKKHSVS